MKRFWFASLLGLALAPAGALERGVTDQGQPFVSGGVGATERSTLDEERNGYDLAILTAARGSGNYLADVHIRITDAQSVQVLDTTMDGPWLFVELPAGRYQVEATRNSLVQKHFVNFLASGHSQTVFYFDNRAEVDGISPDSPMSARLSD
jgi:hypothetical protein